MLNKISNWLQFKLGIRALQGKIELLQSKVKSFEVELTLQNSRLSHLESFNIVDGDVSVLEATRGNNTIIMTGIYRGKPYVKFYDIEAAEFKSIVEHYQKLRKTNVIRHLDSPIRNMKYVFEL